VSNIGKQTKTKARINMLWDVLETVKTQAEPAASVAWVGVTFQERKGNLLEVGEGYHLAMHLAHRGRRDLEFAFVDPRGQSLQPPEIAAPKRPATWLVSGTAPPPERFTPQGNWNLAQRFSRSYWLGLKQYECFLWKE